MSEQSKLFFWNNQNLFSNNYLEYRLPVISLWKEEKEKAEEVFKELKVLYETIRDLKLGPGQEAELEDKFIRPVLGALGFAYNVQPVTKRGFKKRRPDYALFRDSDSYREASRYKNDLKKFFSCSLSILEAKYWGRRLNDTDKSDILDSRDPTAQTVKYLEDVHYHTDGKINWAILTNGKQWRLFYYRASSRSGNFFEVDLEEIIKRDRVDDFLYFYLFFSRDAFIPDPVTGKLWLDWHLEGSESYAKAVSDRLKDLIFDKVFEGLAAGFIHYRKTELSIKEETEESRKEIFKGCLTLLYRLLFLLYAESRNLLPVGEDGYKSVSLSKLKEDIYNDLQNLGPDKMSKKSYTYWARLEGLCNIIAKGDPALNVPVYNGGLFETSSDSFLAIHKMPDYFFAGAIELLTIDHDGQYPPGITPFIDYSSLNVRHLGDIYEGLLEFHLQIAEEEIVEVKEKKKSIWKKASEVKKGTRTYRTKKKGDIYIENSKHERKATGSYYTPHYIVEYIVQNTVGPVLEERLKRAEEILSELEKLYEKQRRQLKRPKDWKHWEHPGEPKGKYIEEIVKKEKSLFEIIFDIKVLDPAMGSGHFLVHTVDYLSDKIISFLAGYPENPVIRRIHDMRSEIFADLERQGVRIDESRLTEVNLIKRMVMKRCIYGVDLNDMAVELAKLSLWLDSFTLGAPLSFLDHHLKCGNSLIGLRIEDLEDALAGQLFAINLEPLKRAIRNMLFISDLPDATLSQVRQSYEKYSEANAGLEGYRILLDMLVADYFGIPSAKEMLVMGFDRIDLNNLSTSIANLPEDDRKLIEKVEKLAKEKYFFHWEIEFPEVFYEQTGEFGQKVDRRGNSGFDCVVGNPPYDVLSELEQGRDIKPDKDFFSQLLMYRPAVGSKLNLYRLFSVLSLHLLKNKGTHGFIVPMALLADKQAKPLREFMLKKNCLQKIEAFPQKDDPTNRVFLEAKLSTCIYILRKEKPLSFFIRIHAGKDILETSTYLTVKPSQVEEFDKENLSIPSYPTMTMEDFKLAVKLNRVSGGISLKHFTQSQQGEVNLTAHSDFFTNKEKGRVVLRGAHVNRYEFQELPKQGDPVYLDVKKFLKGHGKNTKAYDYRHIRIGYQRGSAIDNWRRIIATIIERDNFCSDTINYIVNPKEYDLFAILALLNSSLWEWRFRLTSTNNHVNSYEIDSMPMPPISFEIPKNRQAMFKALKAFYESNKYDEIVSSLDLYIPKVANDNSTIKRKASYIIHDLLAFLAEQMIVMNKKKNEEIKGFLKWLEREIGTGIENLSNKTALKEYHNHDFTKLLEILKKNRKKLSIDPSDRKIQEKLEKEFNRSMSILEPLKANIKKTDELIDEIVYRLYGLTEEEIRIVKGEKN